jgi:hypothetical protein
LFAVWDGNLDTKTVGQRLEDMGMKVTVSNDGKFIEAHDGMDDFRVRRQM